jgi:hypothetical protein
MSFDGALRLALLAGLVVTGCGDDSREPRHGSDAGSSGSPAGGSAPVAAAAGEGGSEPTAAGGAEPTAAGGADAGSPGSPVEVVDIESDDGELSDADASIFLEPDPSMLAFDRAGVVGDARFAFDSSSLALVTFDPLSGASTPALFTDCAAAAGFGSALVTLEIGLEGELLAKAYSAALAVEQEGLLLAEVTTGSHALGAAPSQLLALWSSGGVLRGQLLTPDALEGEAFDLGPQSCADDSCESFALWTGERFVALWSRADSRGQSVLSWASIDGEGRIASSSNVLQTVQELRLASAALLPGGRVGVLLTEGTPAVAPLLAFVDAFGALEPTLHRYLGATEAWGLASHGDTLALVARSEQAQAVLRPLDSAGAPRSGWVILDDSGPNTDFEPLAALFTDEGYAAVVRRTDGSSAYLPLDELGQRR